MKRWQKILATAGVVATLVASAGLTGCTKTGEDVSHKYLILKQFDRNYTLHCLGSQNEGYKYDTKCGVGVVLINNHNRTWIMRRNQDGIYGCGYLEAFFSCKDEDAVRKIGYEDVCSTCFPDGYEQE